MFKKLGKEPSVLLHVRIPGELYRALESLTDEKNPMRELVREALKKWIAQYRRIE